MSVLTRSAKMNREEAKQLLLERLRPLIGKPYDELSQFVGVEHVEEVRVKGGTDYYYELYVSQVNEDDDLLVVEGLVHEVNGRRLFPPTEQASFTITRSNQINFTSQELSQKPEGAEQ